MKIKRIFLGIGVVLKVILKIIGIILKGLLLPLTVLSRVGSVGSQMHMDNNRRTEIQAQYKVDEVKRMRNGGKGHDRL